MTARDRLEFFAIAIFYVLLPAFAVGGALGLPVLMCVAALASIRLASLTAAVRERPAALTATLVLAVWVIASTLWSPVEGEDQGLKLAVLVPLGLIFVSAAARPGTRDVVRAATAAAVIVLIVLLAIEALWTLPLNRAAQPESSVYELTRNTSRGAVVLLALVWAASAGLLTGRTGLKGLALLILLSGAAMALQFDQSANVVAFAAGGLFFAAGWSAPVLAARTVSLGLAGWMLVVPFAATALSSAGLTETLPLSWAHRIEMWKYVAVRVLEQPIFGHGLEAARAIDAQLMIQGRPVPAVPVHPHSISLQIWYETGAIGALLAATALVLGGRWLSRAFAANRAGAAAACATLAFLGCIANLSYGAWAEWQVALFFIAAAAVGALRNSGQRAL